jgi:YfiH family protein
VIAAPGSPSPLDAATWSRTSRLLSGAGFTQGFCHHGRPDDAATCDALAPGRMLQQVRQVHGCMVARAAGWNADGSPEADAVISADPSYACAVRTADCAPVLVACGITGAVAAIHAGWRGIACGVIAAAVDAMVSNFGAVPATMVAAVGPCARARRYEVGEEVACAVTDAGCADAVIRHSGATRPFLDVARAAAMQLAACGLSPMRIDADPPCSIESTWCPSHRRDPARRDRMLSLIVPGLPTHG